MSILKTNRRNFDPDALKKSAQRHKNNIQIFRGTIKKEQAFIDHFEYVISQINPDHPDVKMLEQNIKKIKNNILTFEKAISDEKDLIEKELALAKKLDP